MPYGIIDFNPNTTLANKILYPTTAFRIKAHHTQLLLQEGPIDLVVSFLEIYFEKNIVQLFSIKLMDSFMKDYNSF
jgi:hypothetical protein